MILLLAAREPGSSHSLRVRNNSTPGSPESGQRKSSHPRTGTIAKRRCPNRWTRHNVPSELPPNPGSRARLLREKSHVEATNLHALCDIRTQPCSCRHGGRPESPCAGQPLPVGSESGSSRGFRPQREVSLPVRIGTDENSRCPGPISARPPGLYLSVMTEDQPQGEPKTPCSSADA